MFAEYKFFAFTDPIDLTSLNGFVTIKVSLFFEDKNSYLLGLFSNGYCYNRFNQSYFYLVFPSFIVFLNDQIKWKQAIALIKLPLYTKMRWQQFSCPQLSVLQSFISQLTFTILGIKQCNLHTKVQKEQSLESSCQPQVQGHHEGW